MPRKESELYPDYTAELEKLDAEGITDELLNKIIQKHRPNSKYNRELHQRYAALDGKVPIFGREPRYDEDNPVNNKVNNDFFGEIVDFKTGYFAGKAAAYAYADTSESREDTGGDGARDAAAKALSDFVALNNMWGVDMDVTKYAAIAGYAGRMLYYDPEGRERAMALPSYETIVLSPTDITEPRYGIRYYSTLDINGGTVWKAEFDDGETIRFYSGGEGDLKEQPERAIPNLFGRCAIQGIPNNSEMLGDAEKVLELIDAFDRVVSDANNEVESFANAYMAFENINMSEEDIRRGQRSGAFQYYTSGTQSGGIHFITKDINDGFVEHHLDRLEENIYRFSKTPNMEDENFSQNSSGVAMKFKLTGLEAKCGMFESELQSANVYMFGLLAGSWEKKRIPCDPLQCYVTYKRNFPTDIQAEAAAVSALISAGLPKRMAIGTLSFVDDVEEVMQQIEEEQETSVVQSLLAPAPGDDEEQEDESWT